MTNNKQVQRQPLAPVMSSNHAPAGAKWLNLWPKQWMRLCVVSSLLCAAPATWAQMVGGEASDTELGTEVSTQTTNKRMDFSFQDVPARALLQVLGETAGVNIITDETLQGTLSLNLKDATWQEALDVIARQKNLRVERLGQTVYVRGESAMANASDSSSSAGRKPMSNERQVLIEARIVEAEDSFSRSLGVKLGFNDLSRTGYTNSYQRVLDPNGSGEYIDIPVKVPTHATNGGAVFGSSVANVQSLSGQNSGVVGLGQVPTGSNSMINFPALGSASGADPASFAVSLFTSGMNRFINLEISALETDGKGKIISNPRVVTSNNVRAVIEQGTEIPYQQTNALGATNTSFRKASLKLEVTPQIANNGEVTLDVDVTKDSVGVQTLQGHTINTKHVQTQVKIDNGGTLVIGGIYQEDSRNAVDKVPFLGDLPLLGNLFKTTTRSTSKTELLIFLTPHILDARGNILPSNSEKIKIDE